MKTSEAMPERDSLFDRIAELIPGEQRESFYRRMAHLRQLRADDEMLQIAEAMGYLALIIREAPSAVAEERVRLDDLLGRSIAAMQAAQIGTAEYNKALDQRLSKLPQEIATGISPQKIATLIGESIRQKFVETGMPYTADALNVSSERMTRASHELTAALQAFTEPRQGAVAAFHRAVNDMRKDLSLAADHVREVAAELRASDRKTTYGLASAALLIGFILGILFEVWRNSGT